MDPRELLSFLRRHRRIIALFIMVGLLLGAVYTFYRDRGERGATLFFTIGLDLGDDPELANFMSNESQNIVDQFTETVQGWLVNPDFINQVTALYNTDLNFSSRKQERQNIVVSLSVSPESEPHHAAEAVLFIIGQQIKAYNEATHSRFVIPLSSITSYQEVPAWIPNILTGGLLFAVVSILALGLWEYLNRRVTFGFQAESILKDTPLYRFDQRRFREHLKGFFSDIDSNYPQKLFLVNLTSLHGHDRLNVHAPGDLKMGETVIAFVQLGKTSEDTLRHLKRVHGDRLMFVLIV